MDVILCGLAKEMEMVEKTLKKEHEIIRRLEVKEECYNKIMQLKNLSCDFLVLAVGNRRESERIIQLILTCTQISEERIIDFFAVYTGEKVDNVMKASNDISFDGMILGLSHSVCGIRTEYLDGKWINLSNGSQDLYYNLQVLKKCVKDYPENIRKLRYALLEMYDYVNFNWDTSVSRMAVYYYAHGGYMEDLHRFHRNINFENTVEKELAMAGYYSSLEAKKYKDIRLQLFDDQKAFLLLNTYQKDIDFCWYSDLPNRQIYSSYIEEKACNTNFFNSHIFNVRHEDVVNIMYQSLLEILKIFKEINPDIKIMLFLMPRYYTMEKLEGLSKNVDLFKEEFEALISSAGQEYEFEYRNYKDNIDISYDNKLYYDVCHLNYNGAVKFTKMLNMDLQSIR